MAASALLLIDMQAEMAARLAAGRDAAPAGVEGRVAALLSAARAAGVPVVHVHHDDPDPEAAIRLDRPGGRAMACAAPLPGEAVVVKRGSSGFAGTDLEGRLRALGVGRVVVAGAVLGFCVSSTVRDAVARGFTVDLVEDAVLSFDLPDGAGGRIPAAQVRAVHGRTLALDFARPVATDAVDFG
jgi:nicotinamidase-related amidase